MSASWNERDAASIWHPFTQLFQKQENITIVKSEGSYYYDENGRRYIDAISSWWVNLHGHCHPYISKRVSAQLFSNEHSIFSGFTHPNAILLAEKLLHHLPSNQSKIFYSDNGSTAVEVAIKMALQFFYNKSEKKNKLIYFKDAYHGDTFGGMSVAERNVFNMAFQPNLFQAIPLPSPSNETACLNSLKEVLDKNNDIAAFIFEPLIQGAAGMQMHSENILNECLRLCRENNVLCIADEVMTGFYRTGAFFACNHLNISPDIMCMSKGLSGGYLPLGVTSCTQEIQNAFLENNALKTFYHGHSFTANPTSCAAALASIELLEKPEIKNRIREICELQGKYTARFANEKNVLTRHKGTIVAFEFITNENSGYLNKLADKIYPFFIEKGILLRPLGNVLYVLPPYCISNEDLDYIYSCIGEFIYELNK
jgi:adenosylmethionine-8-amino-7-oxononanoate aminotransferase